MKIFGKEINDECKNCGKILDQGHGIGVERTNVSEMVRCQLDHYQRDIPRGEGTGF